MYCATYIHPVTMTGWIMVVQYMPLLAGSDDLCNMNEWNEYNSEIWTTTYVWMRISQIDIWLTLKSNIDEYCT